MLDLIQVRSLLLEDMERGREAELDVVVQVMEFHPNLLKGILHHHHQCCEGGEVVEHREPVESLPAFTDVLPIQSAIYAATQNVAELDAQRETDGAGYPKTHSACIKKRFRMQEGCREVAQAAL